MLRICGIESKELAFIASYLKNRTQFIDIDGHKSATKIVTHGVPQRSVLGPLLFIVFINDLPKAVAEFVVDIYADDTTISASAACKLSPTEVQQQLQEDIDQVTKRT